MIILSSPAKTLDFNQIQTEFKTTNSQFLDESAQIVDLLAQLDVKELSRVLKVSPKLSKLAHQYYQDWKKKPAAKHTKPAIFAYQGTVFQQLSVGMYTKDQQQYAQDSLRIISALYGLLRPFDLIQPYRLEMTSKLKIDDHSLYEFWRKSLTQHLKKQVSQDSLPMVVDLSSQSYSKAIDQNELDCPWYTVEFKQIKGQKKQNVGMYAKQARGMMIDSLIRNQANSFAKVTSFHSAGYRLDELTSNKIIFVRDAQ